MKETIMQRDLTVKLLRYISNILIKQKINDCQTSAQSPQSRAILIVDMIK